MKKIAFFTAALFSAAIFAHAQDLPDTAGGQGLPSANAAAKVLPKIAVYVTGDVPDNEKKALGTRMLASLVNSGRYKGIERSNSFLAEIEKEQVKQRSGEIDDNQISALGKQFGVKFVCIADITPAYGSFQVSARIVNVETAEVDFIGDATSKLKTIDDLAQVSDKVVRKMFGGPDPKAVPQAQETPDDTPWWKPKMRVSAGAGGFFTGDFGGGIKWECGEELAMPHSGWGAYIFVDAAYAEIFAGYAASGGPWRSADAADQSGLPDARRTHAHGGLFVKYPLTVKTVKLFPLLGAEYEYSHTAKLLYDDANDYIFDGKNGRPAAKLLSAVWVKFGGGADVDMGRRLYMRAEILYGFRGANKYEEGRVTAEKTKTGEDVKTISGNGLTLKTAIGVKF